MNLYILHSELVYNYTAVFYVIFLPIEGLIITTGRFCPRSLTTCSASDLLNMYVFGRFPRILKFNKLMLIKHINL
jgi:hypothetical protein